MINRQQFLTVATLILLSSGGQAAASYSAKLVSGDDKLVKFRIREISAS